MKRAMTQAPLAEAEQHAPFIHVTSRAMRQVTAGLRR